MQCVEAKTSSTKIMFHKLCFRGKIIEGRYELTSENRQDTRPGDNHRYHAYFMRLRTHTVHISSTQSERSRGVFRRAGRYLSESAHLERLYATALREGYVVQLLHPHCARTRGELVMSQLSAPKSHGPILVFGQSQERILSSL